MALPFVCALLAFAASGSARFINSLDQPGQSGGSYGWNHDEQGQPSGGYSNGGQGNHNLPQSSIPGLQGRPTASIDDSQGESTVASANFPQTATSFGASGTFTTYAPTATSTCTNSAANRQCWSGGYNIDSDTDITFPSTGVTRYYDWTITNGTAAPDGFERPVFLVNSQYPGPTLFADWGDTVSVTVHNQLQDNGTTVHWHGVRQFQQNPYDGVPGVTQCPIAPGESTTYTFLVTQHGTSWWHTHLSTQWGDGIWGSMIFYGPSVLNWDVDLGAMPINDWYHQTVWSLLPGVDHDLGPPPAASNALINGSMTSSYGGQYSVTTVSSGKRFLLRLINSGFDNSFMVSLDNHQMTVIENDFAAVQPFNTTWLFIGIGQRYNVIIDANQPIGNYWLRAINQEACGQFNDNANNVKSIFRYEGAPNSDPTTSASGSYTPGCGLGFEPKPYWNKTVPEPAALEELSIDFLPDSQYSVAGNVVSWSVNSSIMYADWGHPLAQYLSSGNTSYPGTDNVITLPNYGDWYYFVLQQAGSGQAYVPHPIHLHGHTFQILGSGTGAFPGKSALNFQDPNRRDVAMLPGAGWLAIAMQADNPGAWILHCHIGWHADQGFAMSFAEAPSQLSRDVQNPSAQDLCDKWNAYFPNNSYWHRAQDDSGV
ncbi:multicopper type 1 protein [Teratosphaeria destructans]|uniref:laccase n=1 Tax=Teratosphaeria destructans TaxID=418781 RepID=A0A9W7SLR8_9PEZI|nr:multicopper type 1 protein [Teratosphaeria destructans]